MSQSAYILAENCAGSDIELTKLNLNSVQGDKAIVDIAEKFRNGGDLSVIDASDIPDLVPAIAVMMSFWEKPCKIINCERLRIKECDRIAVPAQELSKVGVRCDEHDDGLTIHGDPALASRLHSLDGIAFSAHGDHRIAMSLALLELRGGRLTLDDPSCVSKSFPNFWECWGQVRV